MVDRDHYGSRPPKYLARRVGDANSEARGAERVAVVVLPVDIAGGPAAWPSLGLPPSCSAATVPNIAMLMTALVPIVAATDFTRGVRPLGRVNDGIGLTVLVSRGDLARDHSLLL